MNSGVSEKIRNRESFLAWVQKKEIVLDISEQQLSEMDFYCEDVVDEDVIRIDYQTLGFFENEPVSIYGIIKATKKLNLELLRPGQALIAIVNHMSDCGRKGGIILPVMYPLVSKYGKFSLIGHYNGRDLHISSLRNNSIVNASRTISLARKK